MKKSTKTVFLDLSLRLTEEFVSTLGLASWWYSKSKSLHSITRIVDK